MANANRTTATTTRRRPGRPSNASKVAAQMVSRAQQMEHVMLAAQAAGAAAASVVMSALEPGLATVVQTPAPVAADAGRGTSSKLQSSPAVATVTAPVVSKRPGRKPDPASALSQARVFAAAHPNMSRSDMVESFTRFKVMTKDESGNLVQAKVKDKDGNLVDKHIDKATANTYYHLIHGSKKDPKTV